MRSHRDWLLFLVIALATYGVAILVGHNYINHQVAIGRFSF